MTFRVRNLAATRAFYENALAPLGYRLGHGGEHDGVRMLGFFHNGKFDTWFIEAPSDPSGPTHLAWRAETRAAVDAFYRAAMAHGGRDNGPPGLRPRYHANYYGAFVLAVSPTETMSKPSAVLPSDFDIAVQAHPRQRVKPARRVSGRVAACLRVQTSRARRPAKARRRSSLSVPQAVRPIAP